MTWLLILQSFLAMGLSTTQAGPFASEQECVAAGEKVKKEFPGKVSFVCVQASGG